MLKTVKIPEQFKPIFEKAQEYVSNYFKEKKEDPSKGTIGIFGERYILVRAASLSIGFFKTVTKLYEKEGIEEAMNIARQLLFDIAHAIGMHDAKTFHKKMNLKDPIEKLSAGPIHFSHSGWAFVDIFPESRPSPDENYYLIYDHPYSFESAAWLHAGKKSDFPVCIMNAGYSSGWCEESFGLTLVASEIMCQAKGDPACRFIMAPPSKIEGHIAAYMKKEPKLAEKITKYEIPGFFKRKEIEAELRDSEQRFRAIFDNAMVGMLLIDLQNKKFIDANKMISQMLGYSFEEIKNLGVMDIYPESSKPLVIDEFAKLTEEEIIPIEDLPLKRKDGTVFYAVVNFSPVTLSGKNYLIGIFKDVTKRKQAEELLQRAHDELEVKIHVQTAELRRKTEDLLEEKAFAENTLNSLKDLFFVFDLEGRFLRWNKAVTIILGYSDEDMSSMKPTDFFTGEDVGQIEKAIKTVIKNGYSNVEAEVITKDGRVIPYSFTGTLLTDHQGKPISITGVGRDITERKLAEEEIKALQRQMEFILGATKTGLDIIDSSFNIRYIDPEWKKIYGDPTDRKCYEYFMDRSEVCPGCGIIKALETKTATVTEEILLKEGNRPIQVTTIPFQNDKGEWLVAEVNVDITERKRAEETLRNSEEKYRNIFENIQDVYYETALDGTILEVSPSIKEVTRGQYKREDLIGKSMLDFYAEPKMRERLLLNLKKRGSVTDYEIILKNRDGSLIPCSISAKLQCDTEGKPIKLVGSMHDITERKQMQEKLEYLAYYDALTGLPNRNLFVDRLNQGIARAKHTSRFIAVLIIDIYRFKYINDTYGFESGDKVLKEIAGRLSNSVRDGDTVARFGNDEFGIACIDVADPDDTIKILEKITKDISFPLRVNKDEITLTFNTGISIYPLNGENSQEIIKTAGLALAVAKKEGRKTYQFYTEDMNVKALDLMLMEQQLRNALKNEEFILHYQPYWEITTKRIVGMEALIRWQSKDKGLVPPGKFIPVLEDTGMIIEVGEWILRTAMRQVKEWQDKRHPVVPVSVNMSLIQFRQKDLADMVKRVMGECGFYPSLLTLEITESAFMQDIEYTSSVLKKLKDIGVSVSIDDFGTGYSSLSYLKRFPIDNLKIDISFIREMIVDPDSASIVVAIINMAHTLNLKTIAEGIETEEQWNFLRLLRCDMGQGFYLGKPIPAEDTEKLFIS